MKTIIETLVVAFSLAGLLASASATERTFSHPDRIRYDSHCLTIDGKDVFIYSGAFHYFRCPKELWSDRFQKIKSAGFNAVETYVAWNWSEQKMPAGTNDFSKVNLSDFEDFLKMAEKTGLYVIVRPGPYICAEWDTGGFPQWLLAKQPAHPLRGNGWLRTDDPVYLAWCRHWFDAVCPVIARHQITRKAPGRPGVILVQLENEYDFESFPDEVKLNQVRTLAEAARANGIEVPLFTCLTHQVRGSSDPVIRQVFDACNFYPRWDVNSIQKDIAKLRREQPDAPLATTELQGGWFAEVGGLLSEQQEGVTAAQINNLTLFAIQNGETIMNYYMLFGGSNPGDWTARNLLSSYDYNAPIRECGGVGDRYQRVWALGHMLREHGPKLARAELVDCDVTTPQNDVTVVERRALDGSRYLFVRTSQHAEPREGTAHVREKDGKELAFDYKLEPFGSTILYLPPGVDDAANGQWLPKAAPAIERPTDLPPSVTITAARVCDDPGPSKWEALRSGVDLAHVGIYDSQFMFYRGFVQTGSTANVRVKFPAGDVVLARDNGKRLEEVNSAKGAVTFEVPLGLNDVQLLYENHGHANFGADKNDLSGITEVQGAESLQIGRPAGLEKQWWKANLSDTHWQVTTLGGELVKDDAVLKWYRMSFEMPPAKPRQWVPWHVRLYAHGNGFVYFNGHAIGRYWEAGPQHDFFLPECWLKFEDRNNLTVSLRPTDKGASIQSAVVEPYAGFAENR